MQYDPNLPSHILNFPQPQILQNKHYPTPDSGLTCTQTLTTEMQHASNQQSAAKNGRQLERFTLPADAAEQR